MHRLVDALYTALSQAGFAVCRSFRDGTMPVPEAPMTAVGLKSAKSAAGTYTYLGMQEQDGALLPLYGRSVSAELTLCVYAARSSGSACCTEEADALTEFLSQGVSGLRLGEITVGKCEYDAKSDCFRCTLGVHADGFVYAHANEDETEFTDFILKGEIT